MASIQVRTNVNPDQFNAMVREARRQGMHLQEWVRKVLLKALPKSKKPRPPRPTAESVDALLHDLVGGIESEDFFEEVVARHEKGKPS